MLSGPDPPRDRRSSSGGGGGGGGADRAGGNTPRGSGEGDNALRTQARPGAPTPPAKPAQSASRGAPVAGAAQAPGLQRAGSQGNGSQGGVQPPRTFAEAAAVLAEKEKGEPPRRIVVKTKSFREREQSAARVASPPASPAAPVTAGSAAKAAGGAGSPTGNRRVTIRRFPTDGAAADGTAGATAPGSAGPR
jgi:hypothetical protein